MLLGIDARVTPELLFVLAKMGHGDEIVIADANYPARRSAAGCQEKNVISYAGFDAPQVADLITTLMPLDGFHSYAALRMEVDGTPAEVTEAHQAVWDVLTPRLPENGQLKSIERQAFYRAAQQAFAVVQCAEARPFGCFILRKGVVFN